MNRNFYPLLMLLLCAFAAFVQPHGSQLYAEAHEASASRQDAPTLQWELVNSFRFISAQKEMDELRNVYERLSPSDRTAYNLERALQKLADDEVEISRAEAGKRIDCANARKNEEKRQCFRPYPGWFAKLAANYHQNTCWDSEHRRFRNVGVCENYLYPKKHRIRVWISSSQLLGERPPQWFVNNQPLADSTACPDKYPKGACVEFGLDYDSDERKPSEISVKFSDNSLPPAPISVLVRDKLVVGLGDSYASGEGNPDIPAQFATGRAETDFLLGLNFRQAPRKDNHTKVAWLDKRCHRSMYSYQFKTALMLALANPQEAVTYVSYSCSGATTDNIIDKKQKSREGGGSVPAQLKALRDLLANGKKPTREIDYVLLSSGGNDIGFGKYVAYVVTARALRSLAAHGVNEEDLKKNEGRFNEKLLAAQSGNYPRLHAALLDKDKGVRIKGCESGKPCERILLTPYPDIFNDENGGLCTGERGEFNTPFQNDQGRARRIQQLKRFVFEPLRTIQLSPDLTSMSGLGWTVVQGHFDEYARHGFCAQNPQSASLTAEQFVIPTREDGEWSPFPPRHYKAFEARQRWVRLPVDAKLTTDQVHILWNISFDLLAEDDSSNIMHPTAEALATHADANFREIKRLEGRAN